MFLFVYIFSEKCKNEKCIHTPDDCMIERQTDRQTQTD